MVFLDFFEALLGCAEVYVVEASEQPDLTAMVTGDEQQGDKTTDITPEQTSVPSVMHSLSAVEQVSHITLHSAWTAATQSGIYS